MKHYAPILALIALSFAFQPVQAQSKKAKDTTVQAPRQANDSTPLLTYKDFQELNNLLQDLPAKYANAITQWLQQRYQLRAQEYMRKPQ